MSKTNKWQLIASIISTATVTLLLVAAIFAMVWSSTKAIDSVTHSVACSMMGYTTGVLSISIS